MKDARVGTKTKETREHDRRVKQHVRMMLQKLIMKEDKEKR